MDRTKAFQLLQIMIDFFEAGNKQADAMAKEIIESDFDSLDQWRAAIKRLKDDGEWTGLRAPEADIVVEALRLIQEQTDEK